MLAFKTAVYENSESCGSAMIFMHSGNGKAGDWILTVRAETYSRAVKDGAEKLHQETAGLLQNLDEELARQRHMARLKLASIGLRGRPDAVYRFFVAGTKSDSPAWMENSSSIAVKKTIQEAERRLEILWGVKISVKDAEPDFITAAEGTAQAPQQ